MEVVFPVLWAEYYHQGPFIERLRLVGVRNSIEGTVNGFAQCSSRKKTLR